VASALACWSGGAFGAEMPKELRGEWCSVDDSYSKYVKCKKPEDLSITREGSGSADFNCALLNVSKQPNDIWIVKERCKSEGVDPGDVTTQYARVGNYLFVRECKENCPVQPGCRVTAGGGTIYCPLELLQTKKP
jgi:hypothetical protein